MHFLLETLIIFLIVIVLIVLYMTFQIKKDGGRQSIYEFRMRFDSLEKGLSKLESMNKDEFFRNREEINKNLHMSREELTKSLKSFEERLDKMRETMELRLQALQEDNNKKLEKMRETVDEKLHKTLEERLGESFKLVSDRLELVHKGLGEMQTLAIGVGDLKKVLSNVKTRGVLGEIQLENILEQILIPDQYAKNVCTKKGSKDHVEFAIKLPGKEDSDEIVYLPIDSKFHLEIYHKLLEAYDFGDQVLIEEAGKRLEASIKKSAKEIRDKYIDPPNTTDFGLMFLPIEGLYAEVVRRTGLIEVMQREYKINITGPTTLAALLNSLQMGFRTLAIEKRSSEVWKTLGAVKTEFDKFGNVLNKAQDKLNQASREIDTLVGARTKQIQRKLKNIESLAMNELETYLGESSNEDNIEE